MNGKPLAEVCREHNLHPVMVHTWKKQYRKDPEKAFSGKGNLWKPEAEVATAVVIGVTSACPPRKIFNADHPFIFIIQERETGNILFLGRVSDPRG